MRLYWLRRCLVKLRAVTRDLIFRAIALLALVIVAIAAIVTQSIPSDKPAYISFIVRTVSEPVAFFTFILSISTIGLWIATGLSGFRQSRDMKHSLAIAGKAADAAKASAEAAILNANAAVRSELPIVSPSHVALFESDNARSPLVIGYPPKESVFEVNFKNRGRSPGELIEVCLEWHITDKLPEIPDYRTISPYPPGIFIDVNADIPGGPIKIPIRLQDDEVSDLPNETVFLWVYGYVAFRDSIVGDQHISRFCAKWQPYRIDRDGALLPVGFMYDPETPAEYTRKT